jgi:hypothetical protein
LTTKPGDALLILADEYSRREQKRGAVVIVVPYDVYVVLVVAENWPYYGMVQTTRIQILKKSPSKFKSFTATITDDNEKRGREREKHC